MAASLIYQRASDNVAPNATVTVQTGTAATGYPAANLVDLNPAKPAKLVETTGAWLFDFGSAQRVDLVAIVHHNLNAGLNVRIQANATDSWGTPTIDAAFTIPAQDPDLFRPGPWLDLTAVAGYSAGGFRYWRLVVVGTNSAPVAIGEIWLGSSIRTLDPNIQWGATDGDDHQIVEHATDFGVATIFDLGTRTRTLTGQVDTTDSNRDDLRAWFRSTHGRAQAFLVIPDGDVNDALLVRFTDTRWAVQLNFQDRNIIQLGFQELSRGLYL